MKIVARTIEELIAKSGARAEELRRIDALVSAAAPSLQRRLFSGPSITMIGYGELTWQNMSSSGVWPVIAIAPQKHQISIYVAADKRGKTLVQMYDGRLGKANHGKHCIRFRRFEDLNQQEMASLVKDAAEAAALQERIHGRNCAKPVV